MTPKQKELMEKAKARMAEREGNTTDSWLWSKLSGKEYVEPEGSRIPPEMLTAGGTSPEEIARHKAILDQMEQDAQAGRPLPPPTADDTAGMTNEQIKRRTEIYRNAPGFQDPEWVTGPMVGNMGSYNGAKVMEPYGGIGNTQVGRALTFAPTSVADGVENVKSVIGSAMDVIPTAVTGRDPGYSDVASSNRMIPGDSIVEGVTHGVGNALALPVGGGIAATKLGKFGQGAVLGALESLSTGKGDGILFEGLMSNPGREGSDAETLKAAAGRAIDFMTISGMLQGVGDSASYLYSAAKEKASPLIETVSGGFAKDKVAQKFVLDFMAPIESMEPQVRERVYNALIRSTEGVDIAKGDSFSRVFTGLDQLKKTKEFEDIAPQLSLVQDHALNMKNSVDSSIGKFVKTKEANDLRGAAPIAESAKTARGIASPEDMARAADVPAQAYDDAVEGATEAQRFMDAKGPGQTGMDLMESYKEAKRQADVLYGNVKEELGDIVLDEDNTKILKTLPKFKKSETINYRDAMNSLEDIRTAIRKTNDPNVESQLLSVVEDLYENIPASVADTMPEVAQMANQARAFYRDEFKGLFNSSLGGRTSTGSVGRDMVLDPNDAELADMEQSFADVSRAAVAPTAQPKQRENMRTALDKFGPEGSSQRLTDLEQAPAALEAAKKNEKFVGDASAPFRRDGVAPDVVDGKQISKRSVEEPTLQFSEAIDGGRNGVRNLLDNIPEGESRDQVEQGLKRSWLEKFNREVSDNPLDVPSPEDLPEDLTGLKARQSTDKYTNAMKEGGVLYETGKEIFGKDEASKKAWQGIRDVAKEVNEIDKAVSKAKDRFRPGSLRDAEGNDLAGAQAAKNIIVTMTLGVLNPAATRARNIGGILVENAYDDSIKLKYLDELMADPTKLNKLLKEELPRLQTDLNAEAAKRMIDTYFKRALTRSFFQDDEKGYQDWRDNYALAIEQEQFQEDGQIPERSGKGNRQK